MQTLLAATSSLLEMFDVKLQEFGSCVDSTHMVWLEEIQQEANRMFSSDFNAEPELMPKTPSQKKRTQKKRVSVGQNGNRSMRRFSKGKRSNLRTSLVPTLKLISEGAGDQGACSPPEETEEKPKRSTRRNKQKQPAEAEPGETDTPKSTREEPEPLQRSLGQTQPRPDTRSPGQQEEARPAGSPSPAPAPPSAPCAPPDTLAATVRISAAERLSAELRGQDSPQGRTASKLAIARPPELPSRPPEVSASRRSSVRYSLKLRRSLVGLRHSMTQESVRRASRRSFLKKKARMSGSTCSSSASVVCVEMEEENVEDKMENVFEEPAESENDVVDQKVAEDVVSEASDPEGVRRFTRSMAQTTPTPPQSTKKGLALDSDGSPAVSDDGGKKPAVTSSSLRAQPSFKRRAGEAAEELASPRKKSSPPKKSQSAIRPNMKSFLHTVQKNQLLMAPGSLSRSTVVKSFIKHTTPLRMDLKPGGGLVERERLRLEALKKKQEQELERKKKLEEEKRRKQEEMKRKRDERLRKVVEARVKEEQREEEKKKKIEQKMAHMEEKNDKLRVERLAEEKAKKKVASKRQEELEQRKRQEEEARRRKILQAEEEEKKQQELLMKRRAEEEQERVRRLAEARRALELKKEQERELLRQQQAAAERERAEREKALALQREVEKAAREKEQREAEERRRAEERQRQIEQERAAAVAAAERNVVTVEIQKSVMKTPMTPMGKTAGLNVTVDIENSAIKTPVGKAGGLNVTVDVERSSPQSYQITPKGGNKPLILSANPEDYGMDQNSDDSTDDESAPRKPIPSWAEGRQLQQAMLQQYFHPLDVDSCFGAIEDPKLEEIFNKSKPRYFKRTSSAVWHSPPRAGHAAY